jgi:hypothetical protein
MKLVQDKNFYRDLAKLRVAVLRDGKEIVASDVAKEEGNPYQMTTAEDGHHGPYPRLGVRGAYEEGDQILVESDREMTWVWIRLDATMDEALVLMREKRYTFTIPFGDKKVGHDPAAFTGDVHLITARAARKEEIEARRCISFNPYDLHENTTTYPHSTANIETRGEAWFASRNATDGLHANLGHGPWPYQSWGINRDPKAAMTIDFGTKMAVDSVRFTIRYDFPHDAYWNQAEIIFDDDESKRFTLELEKTDLPQVFDLPEIVSCQSVRLEALIKNPDCESPFPALTQIEFYGKPEV